MSISLPQGAINKFAGLVDDRFRWTGPSEYGQFWFGAKRYSAHVVAWMIYNRSEVPTGPNGKRLDVSHLCNVKTCVMGRHLIAESRSENLMRGKTGKYPMAHEHEVQS